jgi:hypothetical protein
VLSKKEDARLITSEFIVNPRRIQQYIAQSWRAMRKQDDHKFSSVPGTGVSVKFEDSCYHYCHC